MAFCKLAAAAVNKVVAWDVTAGVIVLVACGGVAEGEQAPTDNKTAKTKPIKKYKIRLGMAINFICLIINKKIGEG